MKKMRRIKSLRTNRMRGRQTQRQTAIPQAAMQISSLKLQRTLDQADRVLIACQKPVTTNQSAAMRVTLLNLARTL